MYLEENSCCKIKVSLLICMGEKPIRRTVLKSLMFMTHSYFGVSYFIAWCWLQLYCTLLFQKWLQTFSWGWKIWRELCLLTDRIWSSVVKTNTQQGQNPRLNREREEMLISTTDYYFATCRGHILSRHVMSGPWLGAWKDGASSSCYLVIVCFFVTLSIFR